jgi:NAD(P)-dependent dehydrogenase (short-subunit alcohol dehydrogenase family)
MDIVRRLGTAHLPTPANRPSDERLSAEDNVNVIQPGATATDANPDTGEFADAMRERTAVGHYGRPEDIANAVAYLARPEAGFITGISSNVDGGFAA